MVAFLFGCANDTVQINQRKTDYLKVSTDTKEKRIEHKLESDDIRLNEISEFHNEPYVTIQNNKPAFSSNEIVDESFESYSELDSLGRCGVALACVGKDIMPTEKRGNIGMVKPTGWNRVKYDFVDGKYLYNRCHLIGYQLTGENANERNLITGTRYMNVDGMLPFEEMVADYVKETDNHVLYRVTPVYEGRNLVASGVQMEGYSVEDTGRGISFNVYCYNAQPGVEINYKTGDSSVDANGVEEITQKKSVSKKSQTSSSSSSTQYILNLNTYKFHKQNCRSVKFMNETNKGTYAGGREDLIKQGYEPCGQCKP
ncbi:MAG: hypothetical protein HFG29_08425 [Eubacterium sp.]|nr:hypothetical protein [Eubacterium sp.]